MNGVEQYRVRLRLDVGGLSADVLGDWAFATLDVLLEDAAVVDADVSATLTAGEVEYDLQVKAATVQEAVRVSVEAVGRATSAATATDVRWRAPEIEHAEVDRVPIPA